MSDQVIWIIFKANRPEESAASCLSFFNERKGIPDGNGTTEYADLYRHPTNGSIAFPVNPEDAELIADAPYSPEITTQDALIADGFWPNSRRSAMEKRLLAEASVTPETVVAVVPVKLRYWVAAALGGAAASVATAHFFFHWF